MALSIYDHQLPYDTHNVYEVTFFDDVIETVVTHTPSNVDDWIIHIERIHRSRLHHLIVGLDIEWRPNNRYHDNPVATLQLCVGRRCLIFQLIHAPSIPGSLYEFLSHRNYTFVGVGIENDSEKLLHDYNLRVSNAVDIGHWAARAFDNQFFRNAGLKNLAMQLLRKEIYKPKSIARSRWDVEWLSRDQVQYACIDAFLSFEIGLFLNVMERHP